MDFSNPGINPSSLKRHSAMEKQMRQLARQIASKESFLVSTEEGNQYITSMIDKELKKQSKSLEERTGADLKGEKEVNLLGIEETDVLPFQTEELNPEIDLKTLLLLKSILKETDSNEEILQKILDVYADPSTADDALEYLEKLSENTLLLKIRETRKEFNDKFSREIIAGKNISLEARAFAAEGLKDPNALRDLYRDVTGKERDTLKLFEELLSQFDFAKLKNVIKFLLNSLGRDLKAKGSSIPKPLLARLMTETRSLQAILALYLFFKGRMNIVYRGFDKNDLFFPKQLTFELMARLFMGLLDDRYPTPIKIIKLSPLMGIEEDIVAQILVFTQFRDAIRNVAPKLFIDNKQKQDLLNSYMDALEELDEALDDDYEEVDEDEL